MTDTSPSPYIVSPPSIPLSIHSSINPSLYPSIVSPPSRAFVGTLRAQSVWNTWKFGVWDKAFAGFRTHTHFLSDAKNWETLQGLSKRGVFFARKLTQSRNGDVMDKIDAFIDTPDSKAGLYWPGYYPE